MSKFYNEESKYPDIGQNNENPYVAKESSPPKGSFYNQQSGGNQMMQSVFLKDTEDRKEPPGCCDNCCKCFSLDNYKDYFKVDNDIVKSRILCSLKFWSGGFFDDLKADYDFYGPFWIYATMVFVCSAIHNLLKYETNSANFAYSYAVIGSSLGIFYILGMAVSALYGLVFGCMGLQSKVVHIVCLYGYSMVNYVIAVVLCIFNLPLLTWLFLLYGAGTKVAFILKNIFEKLQVPTAKKVMVIVLVLIEAFVQLMAIKFALVYNYNAQTGQPQHFMAVPTATSTAHYQGLHFRSHGP